MFVSLFNSNILFLVLLICKMLSQLIKIPVSDWSLSVAAKSNIPFQIAYSVLQHGPLISKQLL